MNGKKVWSGDIVFCFDNVIHHYRRAHHQSAQEFLKETCKTIDGLLPMSCCQFVDWGGVAGIFLQSETREYLDSPPRILDSNSLIFSYMPASMFKANLEPMITTATKAGFKALIIVTEKGVLNGKPLKKDPDQFLPGKAQLFCCFCTQRPLIQFSYFEDTAEVLDQCMENSQAQRLVWVRPLDENFRQLVPKSQIEQMEQQEFIKYFLG
jgi:hypothetical protein